MQYRDFGNTGIKVSVLGAGCMRFPLNSDGSVNEEETAKIWFHIVDLKEEDTMRASMLWFRQTGTNVKEAISNGQCHFGYAFIPDEE